MTDYLTTTGLELEAPAPGDIVTVQIRPPAHYKPGMPPPSFMGQWQERWEHENPHHYRTTSIWRVLAVNGGQAVVKAIGGFDKGKLETWGIRQHRWFDASELFAAMEKADD